MPEPDRRTDDSHGSHATPGDGDRQSFPLQSSSAATEETEGATGADGDGSIDFLQLAQGRREVLVRLAGQTYRLRWTRNDKLILTK